MGRNAIDETSGYLRQQRYVLHDRDTGVCPRVEVSGPDDWCKG